MDRCLKALTAVWLLAGACAPEIGDECESSIDCDVQNRRICDLTQPDGYCTLKDCEPGTCPEEAVCVMFRPEPVRLATTWCLASCDDDDDCRDGYECRSAEDLGKYAITYSGEEGGETVEVDVARNLDKESAEFCTVSLDD